MSEDAAHAAAVQAGHDDLAADRISTVAATDLLDGVPGSLVARVSAEFTVTATWLAAWHGLDGDTVRGTVLSVMAGAQRERRHPSQRHVRVDLRGSFAVSCGADLSAVYCDTDGQLVWLALRIAEKSAS